MVRSMKPGSVIVDMAAKSAGGNCELTQTYRQGGGETRRDHRRLHRLEQSAWAEQSSTLYANNLFRLAEELSQTRDGAINVNMADDAIRGLTVIEDGEIAWPAPAPKLPAPAAQPDCCR